MLGTIRQYAGNGLSAIAAAVAFVVMLPVTIGLMLIMLLAGAVTLATVRHRLLQKSSASADWPHPAGKPDAGPESKRQNPPIEGSYTVISK